MRSTLHRDPSPPSEPATVPPSPAATASATRRRPRATGALMGGLAILALAAAPVDEPVGEMVAQAVTAPVGPGGPTTAPPLATDATTMPERPAGESVGASDPASGAVGVAATGEPDTDVTEQDSAESAEVDDAESAEVDDAESAEVDDAESAEVDDAESAEVDDSADDEVWDDLADCESGDWDRDSEVIPGTARWDYGLEFAHEGFEQFQGGLNFHPDTWDEFRDADMPEHAGHAEGDEQIIVGERVLDAQGWEAWPVCSRMLDLR